MKLPEHIFAIVMGAITSPLWLPVLALVLLVCAVLSIIWPEEEQ